MKAVNERIDHELSQLGKRLSRSLSSELIQHCNERLFEEKVNLVALETPVSYGDLPWELIHDGESYWCLKYALGRSILERSKRRLRSPRGRSNCLLVTNPTQDLDGADIEGIALERSLGSLFDVKKYAGTDLSADEFLDLLQTGQFDVLHFCGHAAHDGGQGFLQFKHTARFIASSSVRISATEIAGALRRAPSPPRIAFVNACSSGMTKGEPVAFGVDAFSVTTSLASAFVRAGTLAYVGALWPIHDDTAAEFASHLYRFVLLGCSIGEAMRLARLAMYYKDDGIRDAWAAYVLYGDPSEVLFAKETRF